MVGLVDNVKSIYELGLIAMKTYGNSEKDSIITAVTTAIEFADKEKQISLLGEKIYEEIQLAKDILKHGGLEFFYETINYIEPLYSKIDKNEKRNTLEEILKSGVVTPAQLISAKISMDHKLDLKFQNYLDRLIKIKMN